MAAHSPGSGENYSLDNNSVYPGEQYCQATGTGTGDGDGNGKVTPVPGDDIIILGATTNHHISPIRLPQNQYFQSLLVALRSLEETAVIRGLFVSGEILR